MDLFKEILYHIMFEKEQKYNAYKKLGIDESKMIEIACYKALKNIRDIIRDDNLNDADCYLKIEYVIQEFEKIGSNGGNRHDNG